MVIEHLDGLLTLSGSSTTAYADSEIGERFDTKLRKLFLVRLEFNNVTQVLLLYNYLLGVDR
jgi:hypothetical protein